MKGKKMAKTKSTKKSSKKKKMATAKLEFRTLLNPKEGSETTISVKGPKLKVGKKIKIKDKVNKYEWAGDIAVIGGSGTIGIATVKCLKGLKYGTKLKKMINPGDLVDVDVTVDTTNTQEAVLYP